eukprot:4232573-Alexandrium_andersonii.AAC.1
MKRLRMQRSCVLLALVCVVWRCGLFDTLAGIWKDNVRSHWLPRRADMECVNRGCWRAPCSQIAFATRSLRG